MELQVIQLKEDKSNPLFASSEGQTLLEMYNDYYPTIGFHLPWVGYAIVRNQQVVGTCGFTGQPKEQKVELAYWTFKAFEGTGVASYACKALLEMARKTVPQLTIIAKTAPEHNASTKILEKNGFVFTEIVQDEEIGDSWLWMLEPARE
ncbi:MAG: family N-acetyltransferase [Cytophagaceae bacterium]|jgi:RimJ/RimL family protein N-acetyltransferase|nr:family N-acetyltransferase [Cytophagaceae bacterium]